MDVNRIRGQQESKDCFLRCGLKCFICDSISFLHCDLVAFVCCVYLPVCVSVKGGEGGPVWIRVAGAGIVAMPPGRPQGSNARRDD